MKASVKYHSVTLFTYRREMENESPDETSGTFQDWTVGLGLDENLSECTPAATLFYPWLYPFVCCCNYLSLAVPTWLYIHVADCFTSWHGTPTCPLPSSIYFTTTSSKLFYAMTKNKTSAIPPSIALLLLHLLPIDPCDDHCFCNRSITVFYVYHSA